MREPEREGTRGREREERDSVLAIGVPKGPGTFSPTPSDPWKLGFLVFFDRRDPKAGEPGILSPSPGDPWPPTVARTLREHKEPLGERERTNKITYT